MNRIAQTITAGVALVGAGLTAVVLAPAASAGVDREKRGVASSGTQWELELERERGVIEYSLDLDSRERGERWSITVTRNGTVVWKGTRTTDRDGEIELDRRIRNLPGVADRFVVRAVSEDGEVVRAVLSI